MRTRPDSGAVARRRRRAIRTLRWTFRKAGDIVVCHLALDDRDVAYELTITDTRNGGQPIVETFADAISALHKQAAIERRLIEQSWSLESFQSESTQR